MPEVIKLSQPETEAQLAVLNQSADEPWQLLEGKLHKQFKFKDFVSAMAFMQAAGEQAEAMNHHPEWCNIYSRVTVNLVTHSVDGISTLDFELASQLEKI